MGDPVVELYARLLSMRRELVGRLAAQFDGGMLSLLGTVDCAVAAVEAELELEEAAEKHREPDPDPDR